MRMSLLYLQVVETVHGKTGLSVESTMKVPSSLEENVEEEEDEEDERVDGGCTDEHPPVEVEAEREEQGNEWNPSDPLLGSGGFGAPAAVLPEQLLAMGEIMPDEEAMMNLAIALSLVCRSSTAV